MGDEQTPQSDLIDDAIRQAERQLEAKLDALRLSALGETTKAATPPADDVAVLRPTGRGASARASAPAEDVRPAHVSAYEPSSDDGLPNEVPLSWQESATDDVAFAPDEGSVTLSGGELYVSKDGFANADDAPAPDQQPEHEKHLRASDVLGETFRSTVTDLTPVWEDEEEPEAPVRPGRTQPAPAQPTREPAPRATRDWDRPDPVHSSWTEPSRAPSAQPTARVVAVPSEDEMQFWAHTRTALRNLQQVTDGLADQVGSDLTAEVSRIVREEVGPSEQAINLVQQQLQAGLPKLADRIEAALEQAMAMPNNGIRQVRDELPLQLDRVAREQLAELRTDLDGTAASVHGAVQQDIAQLEQSIATNVTRMAQSTGESVAQVGRDVDVLGENVVRFERGVHSEFDRVESQLRSTIERVEHSLRDELVEPSETLRKLDEEMPARFSRVERTLMEQLQSTQRDLSTVLSGLVDVNRASLDRIASLASTMDEDRSRRAEDVEVIVATVTTGWEGLAGAIKALFEQQAETSQRIAGIEQRLGQIRDVEGALETTMNEFRSHIQDLQPAPVIVTVAHPEAEVRNSARGGWLPGSPG